MVFKDLQIHPNTISFNAAISSCEKGGKLQPLGALNINHGKQSFDA